MVTKRLARKTKAVFDPTSCTLALHELADLINEQKQYVIIASVRDEDDPSVIVQELHAMNTITQRWEIIDGRKSMNELRHLDLPDVIREIVASMWDRLRVGLGIEDMILSAIEDVQKEQRARRNREAEIATLRDWILAADGLEGIFTLLAKYWNETNVIEAIKQKAKT